jgi:uncharacterized protein
MKVAVIGASENPERYSNKAMKRLLAAGHEVLPVHPRLAEIEGLTVYHSLSELPANLDTITLYIGADRSTTLGAELVALKPKRIIFNPGAENPHLAELAAAAGIETQVGCTLVMLATGVF